MSEISISSIGTLRYAPEGAEGIRAFNYNGVKEMTLGQMVMALCFRRAAQIEETCVCTMNRLSLGTEQLELLSGYAKEVLAGNVSLYNSTIKPYLLKLKVDADVLNAGISSYQTKMDVYEQIQMKMAELDTDNSRLNVDLQSQLGRRDVVYNTSSSSILGFGKSAIACAAALKGRK